MDHKAGHEILTDLQRALDAHPVENTTRKRAEPRFRFMHDCEIFRRGWVEIHPSAAFKLHLDPGMRFVADHASR